MNEKMDIKKRYYFRNNIFFNQHILVLFYRINFNFIIAQNALRRQIDLVRILLDLGKEYFLKSKLS